MGTSPTEAEQYTLLIHTTHPQVMHTVSSVSDSPTINCQSVNVKGDGTGETTTLVLTYTILTKSCARWSRLYDSLVTTLRLPGHDRTRAQLVQRRQPARRGKKSIEHVACHVRRVHPSAPTKKLKKIETFEGVSGLPGNLLRHDPVHPVSGLPGNLLRHDPVHPVS